MEVLGLGAGVQSSALAVPSRDESDGLDLYDALRGLVEAGRIPRWVSLGCAAEAEWEAGEPVPVPSGSGKAMGADPA